MLEDEVDDVTPHPGSQLAFPKQNESLHEGVGAAARLLEGTGIVIGRGTRRTSDQYDYGTLSSKRQYRILNYTIIVTFCS